MAMNKTWTPELMKALLMRSDRAVERAVVVLLDRQTATEQSSERTINHNEQGFVPYDAKIMSSMAKWVMKGNRLSQRQLAYLRNGKSERFPSRIGKYSRQLCEIANDKLFAIRKAIELKQNERFNKEMSDDYAYSNGSIARIDGEIATLKTELANLEKPFDAALSLIPKAPLAA